MNPTDSYFSSSSDSSHIRGITVRDEIALRFATAMMTGYARPGVSDLIMDLAFAYADKFIARSKK